MKTNPQRVAVTASVAPYPVGKIVFHISSASLRG